MSDTTVFGQWSYQADSANDSVQGDNVGGTQYEIFGAALKQTDDRIFVALYTNMPLDGTQGTSAYVRWGDAIFNSSGNNLGSANGTDNLTTVRFDPLNESTGVSGVGVFQNATIKSVASVNGLELDNLRHYINYVNNNGGNHSFGAALPANYFNGNQHLPNVTSGGNLASTDVIRLTEANLANEGLDVGRFGGTYTYGFSFAKDAIPDGDFVLQLAPECANDIITVRGTLGDANLEVVKKVNGLDSNTLEEAIGVFPGSTVRYDFEVRNTGTVGIHYDDIRLYDDQIPFDYTDLPWQGDDGDLILENGEVWTFTATAEAEEMAVTIDFDTDPVTGEPLAAGTRITDLYQDVYGLTISTEINQPGGGVETAWGGMVFDTNNPTGGDPDLRTPGYGPGNDQPLNNVLILSEDNNAANPDDNARGGTFVFQWDAPVQLRSVDLLDIEEPGSEIILYYNGQEVLREAIGDEEEEKNLLDDNSLQDIDFGNQLVDRMAVVFNTSGAIAAVDFNQFHQNTATVGTRWNPEQDRDPAYYTAPDPGLAFTKLINGEDANSLDEAIALTPGSQATFSYVLENTGNMPFTPEDLVITDDQLGLITNLVTTDADGILAPGETWVFEKTGIVDNLRKTIDFETDALGNALSAGDVLDDEYSAWGVNISRVGRNQGAGVMVFDGRNPTGGDDDLFTEEHGNIMILSEDGHSHDPDDDKSGGIVRFEFDELVRVHQVGLFDTEEKRNGISGHITTYDALGGTAVYNIAAIRDGEFQTMALGTDLIQAMEVRLFGSGAITSLEFDQSYRNLGMVNVAAPYNLSASDFAFANTLGI